jgi:hypothetical protein
MNAETCRLNQPTNRSVPSLVVWEQRGVVRQWVDEPPREQDLLVSGSR